MKRIHFNSLLFHGTGYGITDRSYRKTDSDFKNNYPEWWQICQPSVSGDLSKSPVVGRRLDLICPAVQNGQHGFVWAMIQILVHPLIYQSTTGHL